MAFFASLKIFFASLKIFFCLQANNLILIFAFDEVDPIDQNIVRKLQWKPLKFCFC